MLITSEIGYVGHRKITFLSELLQFFFNEKNAFPIIYREDESCPCYHFCSFLPRGQKPCWVRFHADNPTTAVMIGLPLSWYPSAITGGPVAVWIAPNFISFKKLLSVCQEPSHWHQYSSRLHLSQAIFHLHLHFPLSHRNGTVTSCSCHYALF